MSHTTGRLILMKTHRKDIVMTSPKLSIELVPRTSWYSNVRSVLTQREWDVVRKATYRKASYRCEICNDIGRNHPVECHEIWTFDDNNQTQTLAGLISLCPACHEVKHIGLAMKRGRLEQAASHLMKVNQWSANEAEEYIVSAFTQHAKRSKKQWVVDTSTLSDLTKEMA